MLFNPTINIIRMTYIKVAINTGFKDVDVKNNEIKKAGFTGFFLLPLLDPESLLSRDDPLINPESQRFGTLTIAKAIKRG